MARTGRPPNSREKVRRAIREAGTTGILGRDIGVKHEKAQVYRLRMAGMPIVSRREDRCNCRYWASPELAGFPQPRRLTEPDRPEELIGPPKPTLRQRVLEVLSTHRMGVPLEALVKLGNRHTLECVLVLMHGKGEFVRCKVNGNRNRTIYFSTAERMAAYQALAVAPEPPVRSRPKREAPPLPIPATPVVKPRRQVEVITPPGLVPTLCRGYVPPDLSAGAPAYFRSLAIGSYIPSDSPIARAYGSQRA